MVQVVKDPLGNKGARLTSYITLPSRHLVLLPRERHAVGISARIEDDDRARSAARDDSLKNYWQRTRSRVRRDRTHGGRGRWTARRSPQTSGTSLKLWEVVQERCRKS